MSVESTSRPRRSSTPWVKLLVNYLSVVVIGVSLTWTYLSMRAVMGVGGSCATGGPYEIASPCPDGAWLISIAIPLMLVATFVGSFLAPTLEAPTLFLPMWAILFTSLGWNFFEYGVRGDVVISWIVCGVVFWLMAAPAWLAMAGVLVSTARRKPIEKPPVTVLWSASSLGGALWWWVLYLLLGAVGAFLGVATYTAAS